jgi:hypothetical protein
MRNPTSTPRRPSTLDAINQNQVGVYRNAAKVAEGRKGKE